jgi:hypothetical protein
MNEYDGKQFVGIDLHRQRSVIVRQSESGEQLSAVRIVNDPVALGLQIEDAGADPEVVLEATYGWYWAVDVLQAQGAQVHLAHPLGGKGFRYRRVENDVRDAGDLADLLRMGRLPEAWIAPPATRELRGAGALPGQAHRDPIRAQSPPRTGEVFAIRQISLFNAAATRQMHILTTRRDLPAAEIRYRMGSRWRQENHYRYARIHFDLDSHDTYRATDDDPDQMVPNPAKKPAYQKVENARRALYLAQTSRDRELLAASTPPPGTTTVLTNPMIDTINADVHAAGRPRYRARRAPSRPR